ncbi:MAG: hypothetical protein J6C33_10320 [Lachnospiraceae bacterium]|nr:hypothetical protein [Lachnospiraceae bacterium]
MKTFIGSGNGSIKSAVDEATRGLTSPGALLYITAYDALAQTAAELADRYPGVQCIGTSGYGLANGTVGENILVVLGLFGDAKVSCGVIREISRCPVAGAGELEKKIAEVGPGRDNTVCIEFCTGSEEKLVTTFHAALEKKGVQLAGATALGAPEGAPSLVAYNGGVYEDACAYALIKNTTGKAKVFKENIWQKSSTVSHFATKVNTERKSIIELDGKPAASVYSQELGVPRDKVIENVFKNPIGRVVGDHVYISSMKELGPNGEILNYKRFNQNDCVYFLELGDYKAIEEETRNRIRSQLKRVSLVFSIDCLHRYLLYQKDNYFSTYARDMASLGASCGIVCGGEQYNNQHVNQTMVCAAFE